MKTALKLHFSNQGELFQVSFAHPLLEDERSSARGKDSRFCFQWSQGVRALALLTVRTALSATDPCAADVALSGEGNSLAASLDYAITKQPRWIEDMFGLDARGRSLVRRIIKRSNPERKREGPVTLTVNEAALPPQSIEIFQSGRKIVDADMLRRLAEQLQFPAPSLFAVRSESFTPPPVKIDLKFLEASFIRETFNMLWQSDIFNHERAQERIKKIHNSVSVRSRLGKNARLFGDMDLKLTPRERLGVYATDDGMRAAVNRDEPIRCIIPLIFVASHVLFDFLRVEKGFHLTVDFKWSHGVEVRRAVVEHTLEADVFALGIGPATTLLSRAARSHSYEPYFLLPGITHGVTALEGRSGREQRLNYGRYLLLCDEASTPLFCFEELQERGLVSSGAVSMQHAEPELTFSLLREGDPDLRFLTIFPHYALHEKLGRCAITPISEVGLKEMFLFAHQSFLADRARARCFDIALRNAWLELRSDPSAIARVVKRLLHDKEYTKAFMRFSGLFDYTPSLAA